MRRFVFDPERRDGEKVILSAAESYHITKVLRLHPGTGVEVLDGRGGVYTAEIVEVGPSVVVRLLEFREEGDDAGRVRLWLGQGLLKGGKMDGTVQQCTELGVSRLTPFVSNRCQGSINDLRGRHKAERWERIVVAACKQCRRTTLMRVDAPVDFTTMISQVDHDSGTLRLIFWEEEQEFRLHQDLLRPGTIDTVCILLGPEGGLAPAEIAAARESGWQTVSLGRRILRAETATLTAVSLVQYLAGNL
ncbi:16S rRNA (uracil(1498)-N(3))-methyltransferase [Desulfoprunum benzoelyticum]|uniref:Ribosomal RNA small subunit methyltransferase E n=1 Tax=Desulfoprunum benzoelyticum TaxID=1506996 RepID=A0A840V441_9BACT|nr:16S rRNA (uracil(1498)-N(3))-methyltransferase [Desulfoprunum benzoelyticum]MBB5348640.1 16S rRNA (uracil1498-N3)-methyltransferase [Desulfoprunum benzoelyticum]MBM9529893.1 16S rRNA (uracil(1498)-N(3))-methyltransferase [Desulfoprunum benzoelyticum]